MPTVQCDSPYVGEECFKVLIGDKVLRHQMGRVNRKIMAELLRVATVELMFPL